MIPALPIILGSVGLILMYGWRGVLALIALFALMLACIPRK